MLRVAERPNPCGTKHIHDRLRDKLQQKDELFPVPIINKLGSPEPYNKMEIDDVIFQDSFSCILSNRKNSQEASPIRQQNYSENLASNNFKKSLECSTLKRIPVSEQESSNYINGIAVGAIAVLGVIGCLLFSCKKRRNYSASQSLDKNVQPPDRMSALL